jgi:hypothetical protein
MSLEFKDPQMKAERGYSNPNSKVFESGREVLKGRDWTNRVKELRERSGGRCEHTNRGSWGWQGGELARCQNMAEHPHRITLRSKLRDDRLKELLHVCAWCHARLDAQQREEIRRKNRAKQAFLRGEA